MTTIPGPVPRLRPLPNPVSAPSLPQAKAAFLAEAWASATRIRWPEAALHKHEKWFRGPSGKFFARAASEYMRANQVEPQAWIAFVLSTQRRTLTPYSPDVILASDFVASRLSSFRSWRAITSFELPAQTLGGEWAAAHDALLGLQGRLKAIEAEIRGHTIAGTASMPVVSQVVEKHIPDWCRVYAQIEARIIALDTTASDLVRQGTFVWATLIR